MKNVMREVRSSDEIQVPCISSENDRKFQALLPSLISHYSLLLGLEITYRYISVTGNCMTFMSYNKCGFGVSVIVDID